MQRAYKVCTTNNGMEDTIGLYPAAPATDAAAAADSSGSQQQQADHRGLDRFSYSRTSREAAAKQPAPPKPGHPLTSAGVSD